MSTPSDERINKPGSTSWAIFWVLAARQGERLIGVLSIAILARLLLPADFGVVAMAGSIVAIVEVFSAFGFDWALVRLPAPAREHYDTAWTLRVLSGLVISAAMIAVAQPAAAVFSHPEVALVIMAMAISTAIGSFENIWMAEYRRHTRFEPEFKLRIGSKIAGFIVAGGCAVATRSYWALVLGVLASKLTATALSYFLHHARPRWTLSHRRELLNFSVWLLIGNFMQVLRARFSDMWLGHKMGARSVGMYSMASELSALASTELAAPINRAVFASYAQQAKNVANLRAAYLQVAGLIWMVGFPATVGMGVCAEPIIAMLLGQQWTDAVPVLEILAVAGLLNIAVANTHYVYWALGRSRFVTFLSAIEVFGFISLTVWLGTQYGLLGVAWAQVVASVLVVAINAAVIFRTLLLSPMELLRQNYRVVAATIVMGFFVSQYVNPWAAALGASAVVWLALAVAGGAISYFIVLFLLWIFSGKPPGPEAKAFDFLRRYYRQLTMVLKRSV